MLITGVFHQLNGKAFEVGIKTSSHELHLLADGAALIRPTFDVSVLRWDRNVDTIFYQEHRQKDAAGCIFIYLGYAVG